MIFPGYNAKVALALSRENIQSRFISELKGKSYLADTPDNTIQGFVVNNMCELNMGLFSREDPGIAFKDNHLWLFIDNNSFLESNESIVSISIP